jgi:hypothetical protein
MRHCAGAGFQIARFWRAFRGKLRRALCRAMAEGSRYRRGRPAGRMAERARAAPVAADGGQAFGGTTRPEVKYPRIEE